MISDFNAWHTPYLLLKKGADEGEAAVHNNNIMAELLKDSTLVRCDGRIYRFDHMTLTYKPVESEDSTDTKHLFSTTIDDIGNIPENVSTKYIRNKHACSLQVLFKKIPLLLIKNRYISV